MLEINAIFLLENHCLSFSFSLPPRPAGRERGGRRSDGAEPGEAGKGGRRQRQHRGMNCSFVVTGVSLMLSKADRAHP